MTEHDLPVHPFTGLTAIGVLPSGRVVWPIKGGADDPPEPDPEPDGAPDPDPEPDPEGEPGADKDEPLGDKGLKALQAEREKRREADAKRRAAESRVKELEAGTDEAAKAQLQIERDAVAKANVRIVRSEVKAAATGLLADPADAFSFLDLDQFEVNEDGEVDEDAIAEAIKKLIKTKPYLAVPDGKKFQGTGDGGARPKAPKARPTSLGDAVTRKYAK